MLHRILSEHRESIVSLTSTEEHRLPMFGPLAIEDEKEFLEEAKRFYKEWSTRPFPYRLKLNNFEPLYDLGMGAYGKVILVKYKLFEKSYYAMKIMTKKKIIESGLEDFAVREKKVLQGMNSPFCIRLEYYTADATNLYYLLPFVAGGELYGLIKQYGHISENLAKFYVGQIVLALEFLHYCKIIHRDLKPENVLIDHFGFIKIADFGFAKELKNKNRTYTFCGTPDYIAPEVISGIPYFFPADWWAVGVMTFEMVFGQTPFQDADLKTTYKKIVKGEYEMPFEFSSDLKDFADRLLQTDTSKRLGNLKNGVEDIKQHKWFKGTAWLSLLNRRVTPPHIPRIEGDFDTAYFPRLKKLPSNFSITMTHGSSTYEDVFQNF